MKKLYSLAWLSVVRGWDTILGNGKSKDISRKMSGKLLARNREKKRNRDTEIDSELKFHASFQFKTSIHDNGEHVTGVEEGFVEVDKGGSLGKGEGKGAE